uniref:Uncharacterized protein n=1 Tax=Aegilops tauschii subsp. strangulata TaxID=200361 RepID=A0A453T0H2_AEGTS
PSIPFLHHGRHGAAAAAAGLYPRPRRPPGGDLPPPAHPGRARPRLRRLHLLPSRHQRSRLPPPLPRAAPASPPRLHGRGGIPPRPGAPPLRPARRRPRPLRRRFLLRPGRRFFFLLLLPAGRPRRQGRPPLAPPATSAVAASSSIGSPSTPAPCALVATPKMTPKYVLLPTIPEDLAAQPQDSLWEFEPVLASNTSDNGEEGPFKVICIAKYQTKLVLFVFPSTATQWCMAESPVLPSLDHMSSFDYVCGRFYWTEPYSWSDHLMVLDTCIMRFSTVDLLTGYHQELRDLHHQNSYRGRPNSVVTGREGTLEMFSLVRQNGYFALYHTSLQNNSQEWKLEKVISLPGQYHDYSISTVGAAEGFLFFQGAPEVCTRMERFLNRKRALPCFSFPPLLSEPTI